MKMKLKLLNWQTNYLNAIILFINRFTFFIKISATDKNIFV